MAVARRAVGTVFATGNSMTNPAAGTPGLPAGTAAGDLLVMFAWFDTGTTTTGQSVTVTGGSGTWADRRSEVGISLQANSMMFYVFTRVAGAGEAAPTVNFNGASTGTGGGTGIARIIGLTGADTTSASPVGIIGNAYSLTTTTTSTSFGPIPAPAAQLPIGDLIFVYAGQSDDWGSIALLTGNGLTWTEDIDSPSTGGSDAAMGVDDGINGTASPVTLTAKTFTVTTPGTAKRCGRMFSIKQAAPGGALSQASARIRVDDTRGLNAAWI